MGALELRSRLALETRVVTPAPATGTGVARGKPIQPAIFDPVDFEFCLRIDLPSAESGAFSEMVIGDTADRGAAGQKRGSSYATAGRAYGRHRHAAAHQRGGRDDVGRRCRALERRRLNRALKAATSMALSAQLDQQGVERRRHGSGRRWPWCISSRAGAMRRRALANVR